MVKAANDIFSVHHSTFGDLDATAHYDESGPFQPAPCCQERFSNISENNSYGPQNRWSVLYLAEKGEGEKRDRLGKFYAYYQEDELESLLLQAGFTPEHSRRGALRGMAGNIEDWFGVLSWKER